MTVVAIIHNCPVLWECCYYSYIQDDDSVIDCIFNDQTGTVVIQASENIGRENKVLSTVSSV